MKLETKLLLWCQEAVTRLAEDIRLAWVLREFRKEGFRLQTPESKEWETPSGRVLPLIPVQQ
jgi:hypothetical protein